MAGLGIIGLGRIGQLLAEMARPFNMDIVAFDPFVAPERAAEVGAKLVELDELFSTADFVSIDCPPTPENIGLVNRKTLARMKRGAYLRQPVARQPGGEPGRAGRGGGQPGSLWGVGLDVFDLALLDVKHPIFKRENCLTSPHAMATTEGAGTPRASSNRWPRPGRGAPRRMAAVRREP